VPRFTLADGFSLIEALIAASILIAGVAAVVQLLILAIATTHAAGDATRAVILAAQKVEELRSEPWAELAGGEERIGTFIRRWWVTPLAVDPDHSVSIVIVVERPQGVNRRATLAVLRTRTHDDLD
jgi:Tfp pilus assembly protein PilV